MIELDKDTWYEFVYNFTNRLNANYNVEECLKMFVEDYWSILDGLAGKAMEEEKEESLDIYFERKMKPMWDYVYNLEKLLVEQQRHIDELKFSKQKYGGGGLKAEYPSNSVPLGACGGHIHTTGYMQTQYTQE